MAAAQTDRDPPSALSSEFLNFSAKDTASVSRCSSCRSCRPCPVPPRRHRELFFCVLLVKLISLRLGYTGLMLMLAVVPV